MPASATILMIDDDLSIRTLFGMYITGFGYRALLAANGIEALRLAREHSEIQLIVLDVVMSGIGGQKLADQLTDLLPDAALLFCSGYPADEIAALGVDVSGSRFMQKPWRPLELKQRISEMFTARHPNDRLVPAEIRP